MELKILKVSKSSTD